MKVTPINMPRHYWLLAAIAIASLSLSAFTGCGGTPIEISLSEPTAQQTGLIYIDGAVNNPGIYSLTSDDSIDALIRAAGGMADGADPNRLEIYIPRAGDTKEPQKIDLNRAESWLLEALPGIGEAKAQSIIDYRTQNGLFRSINELLKVNGIGEATFEQIKELVTVAD